MNQIIMYNQLETGTRFVVTSNDLINFLWDNKLTKLENDTDNTATYNQINNLANFNSRSDIYQRIGYLTAINQTSDCIETAYSTAATATHTGHIPMTRFFFKHTSNGSDCKQRRDTKPTATCIFT